MSNLYQSISLSISLSIAILVSVSACLSLFRSHDPLIIRRSTSPSAVDPRFVCEGVRGAAGCARHQGFRCSSSLSSLSEGREDIVDYSSFEKWENYSSTIYGEVHSAMIEKKWWWWCRHRPKFLNFKKSSILKWVIDAPRGRGCPP